MFSSLSIVAEQHCQTFKPKSLSKDDYKKACFKEYAALEELHEQMKVQSADDNEALSSEEAILKKWHASKPLPDELGLMYDLKECEDKVTAQERLKSYNQCLTLCASSDLTDKQVKGMCALKTGHAIGFHCSFCRGKAGSVRRRDAVLGCYDDETAEGSYIMYAPCPEEREYDKK